MRETRSRGGAAALVFSFTLIAAVCSLAPPARAQGAAPSACHNIDVLSVRAARVELYDLQGRYLSMVPREELGQATHATQCGDGAVFLAITTPQGVRLVRRIALELPSTVELPYCPDNVYASNQSRDASSSGMGFGCRQRQPRGTDHGASRFPECAGGARAAFRQHGRGATPHPIYRPRAADGPLLPRVRAHEFEPRCTAPVSDAPSGEQAEAYDLLDNLSGAPLTSRNDIATVGSSGTDAKLNQIVRIFEHVAAPAGLRCLGVVQNAEDIDARQFGAGQILLTRGLVSALRNQANAPADRIADQFAFILAHEYAHVLLCHYTRAAQMSHTRDLLRSVSTVGLLAVR